MRPYGPDGFALDMDEPAPPRQKVNGQHSKACFVLERLDQVEIADGPEAIVAGIIYRHSIVVIYGASGCGKSFFASHMGLHVAAGWTWAGRAVTPGAVVYICAEGAHGFRKRLAAFKQDMQPPGDVPFYVVSDSIDLGHALGDAEKLVDRICQQVTAPIALVIIDTLARAMQGSDENSAADMGNFILNCDRIVTDLDCTVIAIHHSGKDASRGARGSSALRAAGDTEIFVEKNEAGRTATVAKQKDGEEGLEIGFSLEQVEIAGTTLTSCTVRVGEWQFQKSGKTARKPTGQALIAYRALQEAVADFGLPPTPGSLLPGTLRHVPMHIWETACERVQITNGTGRDTKRTAFYRAAKKLQEWGFIGKLDNFVWIAK